MLDSIALELTVNDAGTLKLSGFRPPAPAFPDCPRSARLVAVNPSWNAVAAIYWPSGNLSFLLGGNPISDCLGELIAPLVERREPCFGEGSPFIAGATVGDLLGDRAGGELDSRPARCNLSLPRSRSRYRRRGAEHENDTRPGDALLDHLVSKENRWLEVVEGEASREHHQIAALLLAGVSRPSSAEGHRGSEDRSAARRGAPARLYRTARRERGELYGILKTPGLPIETGALRDIQVRNLDVPSAASELACD